MRSITCRPARAMIRTCVARSATASRDAVSTRMSPPSEACFLGSGLAAAIIASLLSLPSLLSLLSSSAGAFAAFFLRRAFSGAASGSAAGAPLPPAARSRTSSRSASRPGSSPRETASTIELSSSMTRVSSGINPGGAACRTSSAAWQSSDRGAIWSIRPAPLSVCSSRLTSTADCELPSICGTKVARRSIRSRASSTKRGTRSANSGSTMACLAVG